MIPPSFMVSTNSRNYPVWIDENLLENLQDLIAGFIDKVFIITDNLVARFYLKSLKDSLNSHDFEVVAKELPSGESSKSLDTVTELYQFLENNTAARLDGIIALGGGVVGDIASFVASSFKRGMRLVHTPTTLLSQVDSSLGGKTGVNLTSGKNLVGTFYQPHAIVADVNTLSTLSSGEYVSGLAEVIKYGVIADPELLEFLLTRRRDILDRKPDVTASIVERCLKIKARIVMDDEFEENGTRMVLNFGHTIGHAIETLSRHSIHHGQAVAIGIVEESRLAARMGLLEWNIVDSLISLLSSFGLPTEIPRGMDSEKLELILKQDKKVRHGRLILPVLVELGRTQIKSIDSTTNLIS